MTIKKIVIIFIYIFSVLLSSCTGINKKYDKSFYTLADYSADLAETAKNIQPAVVTLLRKRTVGTAPHELTLTSLGSGVLVSKDGYIITNYHNIKNRAMSGISVLILKDTEKHYRPQVIKTDPVNDLALIKIDIKSPATYVSIAADTNKVKTGDTVLAIGSSKIVTIYAGNVQRGTVTKVDDYIFTDAKVSKGYSGGGLFNTSGELIGIPTKLHSLKKISTAIPANKILNFLSNTILTNSVVSNKKNQGNYLDLMSEQMSSIAKENIPFVVQVVAEPTDEDRIAKMMKVSEIMKINLYRNSDIKYKYWHPASGILISADGYILTAYYQVVDNCKKISVAVFDKDGNKSIYSAKVIAHNDDFNKNLALLKIEPEENLPFASINNWSLKKPEIGHLVFTIGNSLHFEQSFSNGIISNFNRGLIQTDAAVNNGNLGSPLINDSGKLIGLIIKREYSLNGISLAVSADKILPFIEESFPLKTCKNDCLSN